MWIEYWRSLTGDSVDYAPFQEIARKFPHIPHEDFKKSVQLITTTGEVLSGARAVLTTLRIADKGRWLLWLYERLPGFFSLSEWLYRFIARNRNAFYKFTVLLWGQTVQQPSYHFSRSLFLRCMGFIYCIAFFSLSVQILGLVGSQGILPASDVLEAIRQRFGGEGWYLFPTLTWFNASDAFLQFLCLAGVVLSIVLIIGLVPKPISFLLWLLYLSLCTAGQDFLSFQWDILLLEAGFLTIFLAPFSFVSGSQTGLPPSKAILWLIRLLLFRLMFQSGVLKLTSGDISWTNLTALTFHYETQCIPTMLAWYVDQFPLAFQKLSVVVMFFIELVVPFTIFAPRRLRMLGAFVLIGFQILIILTGNYTFFNYLTIVLCLTLFDDRAIRRIISRRLAERITSTNTGAVRSPIGRLAITWFTWAMVVLNLTHLAGAFVEGRRTPELMASLMQWSSHFGIVNSYGLFRVITTSRPEIIVEGSNDGREWRAYEFKHKPGDTLRAPPWVAPHQPRLDWQMWFAALGGYGTNEWFLKFMVRLLEGSPDVLALLAYNPFPAAPPRYIRALLYEYHFTNAEQHHITGAYWRRDYRGIYLPAISLRRN